MKIYESTQRHISETIIFFWELREWNSLVLYYVNPNYLQNNITRNDSGFDFHYSIGKANVTMTYSLAHLCYSFVQYNKKFKVATSALFLLIYLGQIISCCCLLVFHYRNHIYTDLLCVATFTMFIHITGWLVMLYFKKFLSCRHNTENLWSKGQ
jgi:hypothetical protein